MYSRGREGFGLAFSVAIASLIVVVRQAITGKLLGRKQEPHWWMAWLSRPQHMY